MVEAGNSNSPASLLIGWDVGGWDCDRNRNSRDALVVLDDQRRMLGKPWRGNLRRVINDSDSTKSWLLNLLQLCDVGHSEIPARLVLAIDAPLGFSQDFRNLINGNGTPHTILTGDSNPYLYRETERFLLVHGHRPLSPIKDMIGSQSTKALHVLSRFTSYVSRTGVWSDNNGFEVIEAYPSVARKSCLMHEYLAEQAKGVTADGEYDWPEAFVHIDQVDALICALLAWLFVFEPESLAVPDDQIQPAEGWIWVPRDALEEERPLVYERI